jgi:hypothetical protein
MRDLIRDWEVRHRLKLLKIVHELLDIYSNDRLGVAIGGTFPGPYENSGLETPTFLFSIIFIDIDTRE